jgi:hypothetical protein
MYRYLLIAFLLVIFINNAESTNVSDTIPIKINAKLLCIADSTPVPYANIVVCRTYNGTTSNKDGCFSINVLKTDSLIASSVGYKKTVMQIPLYCSVIDTLVFYIQPIKYSLAEVNVMGKAVKGYCFEKEELPEIPLDERPGQIYVTIPISILFDYFSKKQKRIRAAYREFEITKNWEKYSTVYNKETVMKITGLNETYTDSFMIWFNAKKVLPYNSSEYETYNAISQSLTDFLIEYKLN